MGLGEGLLPTLILMRMEWIAYGCKISIELYGPRLKAFEYLVGLELFYILMDTRTYLEPHLAELLYRITV